MSNYSHGLICNELGSVPQPPKIKRLPNLDVLKAFLVFVVLSGLDRTKPTFTFHHISVNK